MGNQDCPGFEAANEPQTITLTPPPSYLVIGLFDVVKGNVGKIGVLSVHKIFPQKELVF